MCLLANLHDLKTWVSKTLDNIAKKKNEWRSNDYIEHSQGWNNRGSVNMYHLTTYVVDIVEIK